jgi:hypothetical protein
MLLPVIDPLSSCKIPREYLVSPNDAVLARFVDWERDNSENYWRADFDPGRLLKGMVRQR